MNFNLVGVYLTFSKILLKALDDTEESSAVGSAIVLKHFIRLKGSELFHAVPELVQDSLLVRSNFCCYKLGDSSFILLIPNGFSLFAGDCRLYNTTC